MTTRDERVTRARLSLEGLSIGDAFGEQFFCDAPEEYARVRCVPKWRGRPWRVTDDTMMALSIVEVLEAHGAIDRDALAQAFARRYRREPGRGYGGGAHRILSEIGDGVPWSSAAGAAFGGMGSLGNGGAMRVAPLGAWFADDLDRVVAEAFASAEPTHAHPEGKAGAIAVAVAAALSTARAGQPWFDEPAKFIETVADRTPAGDTRDGLHRAAALAPDASVALAVAALGNGSRVSAPDTVPLCVWAAARFGAKFNEALWRTVSALGDRDTTCAIVGGIVAPFTGLDGIPTFWRESREPLPW